MRETTMEDRKKELGSLLAQVSEHPERDWSKEQQRIAVLREMITASGTVRQA